MPRAKAAADPDERRQARRAVAEATRAGVDARKLAKELKGRRRARFEAVAAASDERTRAAKAEIDSRPRRARRLAERAAAALQVASINATATGAARRRALAEVDPKERAKTVKRRQAQAKQAKKMAAFVAAHTIAASITTPTDKEQRKADQKQAKRADKAADRAMKRLDSKAR